MLDVEGVHRLEWACVEEHTACAELLTAHRMTPARDRYGYAIVSRSRDCSAYLRGRRNRKDSLSTSVSFNSE